MKLTHPEYQAATVMTMKNIQPIDVEAYFAEHEIIVSKTDLKGRITYANDIFCRVAELTTKDVIGMQHNIIRHPDMPRAIFHELWKSVQGGKEIFAYVKNMTFTGKYYWVIAHVTPSFGHNGEIVGYHSNRRKPEAEKVQIIDEFYKKLSVIEKNSPNKKLGMQESLDYMHQHISNKGLNYDEFIWGI